MTCALCGKDPGKRSYQLSFHASDGLVLDGDLCYPCADAIMDTVENFIVDTYGEYLKLYEEGIPVEMATVLKRNLK